VTKCIQSRFRFAKHFRREVVGEFSGGAMTSDGGALLLREADQKMNLLARFSQCFLDGRSPDLIEHRVEQMLAQRIYGLALGYEDLNDHEQLRHDPMLGVLAGTAEPGEQALAGKSTLNRMELGDRRPGIEEALVSRKLASRDGLEDLSIGRVAAEAGVGKGSGEVLFVVKTFMGWTP
jgi:Transposase DDE domain group 1